MLLPDNIRPENSIYYNGAFVLQVLQKEQGGLELVELYNEVKNVRKITFPVFVLCIDWLYISGIAQVKDDRVQLCS